MNVVAAAPRIDSAAQELIVAGDLGKLTPRQKKEHYYQLCEVAGVHPATRPFEWMRNREGKVFLYPTKTCTDQLRKNNGITLTVVSEKLGDDGLFTVRYRAIDKSGRADEDVGVVALAGLKGVAAANEKMKAETKAKRRVTLSICGLGMLDESELDSVPGAQRLDSFEEENTGGSPDDDSPRLTSDSSTVAVSTQPAARNEIVIDKDAEPFQIQRRDDIDDAPSWSTWATTLIGYVRAAPDLETIEGWITQNAEELAALQRYDSGKYRKLADMIDHQRAVRQESNDTGTGGSASQ